ncbi:MAG: spermidine synthase [Verrucomicrobiales bacterium]|jgi:spermidine synthase
MHPKPRFEELAYHKTPLGELILRRRTILSLENREVYEIILGDAFLMSSLFTVVEQELATLGLAAAAESFPGNAALDVVVGGLGLGYTAVEALKDPTVGTLNVVDYLEPVIEWHRTGLVPLGKMLTDDDRCEFVHGDFFALALADDGHPGFAPDDPEKRFHAILLDIDHSPSKLLHDRHATFYSTDGLKRLATRLHPGGIFALWSDDPPHTAFMVTLESVFASCESHIVTFENPLLGQDSASTVYVARTFNQSAR